MTDKKSILVVDDTPQQIDMMNELLASEYRVQVALNGEEALALLEDAPKPELILLDIMMPGMDGYEVCRRIRANAATMDLPVIFVSVADSLEERLAGYEAGGNDYITKPFSADELRRKMDLMLLYKKNAWELKGQASAAMDTAMVAMTSASELGTVLNFLRASFAATTFEALADLVIDAMAEYRLNTIVGLRLNDGRTLYRARKAAVSPLEKAVIDKIKDEKRIYDFGKRTVINFPHISLLIKNMPLDDPEQYGRIKDNGALLVEGAEERVKSLLNQESIRAKQTSLKKLLSLTEGALRDIDEQYQRHKISSAGLMEDLLQQVEEAFLHMGLSEQQEHEILAMVKDSVTQTNRLYKEGMEVDQHLKTVVDELARAVTDDNAAV